MTSALPALETLLTEVEGIAADILQGELAALDGVTATWALECCSLIRDALTEGDAAFAAVAGCRLGERLAELRKLGASARRLAAHKSPDDKTYEKDVERRTVHKKYRKGRVSISEADEKAAAELGDSVRTIRRARNQRH